MILFRITHFVIGVMFCISVGMVFYGIGLLFGLPPHVTGGFDAGDMFTVGCWMSAGFLFSEKGNYP